MEYYRPHHLKEALQLLKKWKGKAKLIAGGTNGVPDLRAKASKPKAFIDLSHLKSLSYIKENEKEIRIGALTTISDLSSHGIIQKHIPILAIAAQQLGNPLVRNRATIGGNLADASPAADMAPPLLALEAKVVTLREGQKGREIGIDQFFTGPNQTLLKYDEMIKEIIVPKLNEKTKTAYMKLGLRNSMAISVASLALKMEMEGSLCKKARIGLGAVAPTPLRAYRTEERLTGKAIHSDVVEACGDEIQKEIKPITDIRASAEYRREMISVILKRLIRHATL